MMLSSDAEGGDHFRGFCAFSALLYSIHRARWIVESCCCAVFLAWLSRGVSANETLALSKDGCLGAGSRGCGPASCLRGLIGSLDAHWRRAYLPYFPSVRVFIRRDELYEQLHNTER